MSRKGKPNRKYDECNVAISRCKKCGSTERSNYRPMHEMQIAFDPEGNPVTHVVWRACQCLNCGQYRRDTFYENRVISTDIGKNTTKSSENDPDTDVLF